MKKQPLPDPTDEELTEQVRQFDSLFGLNINTMTTEPTQGVLPTEAQIKDTIQLLMAKLNDPDMKKPINRPVRQGYLESVDILVENRTTYDGIDKLTTVQSRAIAVLAVDYLNGECTQKVLIGVPINR